MGSPGCGLPVEAELRLVNPAEDLLRHSKRLPVLLYDFAQTSKSAPANLYIGITIGIANETVTAGQVVLRSGTK